jgi:hypothetical protein
MRVFLLTAMLLAGCSNLTPTQLREVEPFRFALHGTPDEAAQCIRANAESYSGEFSGEVRGNEVYVRTRGALTAIAVLTPASSGTTADLHIYATFPRETFAAFYMKGC